MTHPQSSDSQILKIDSRQRVRVGRQRREALLDEFERSGLSGPAFSKRHGIKYSTFASWSLKRRKQERPADGLPTLAEIIIDDAVPAPPTWGNPSTSLRVHLPGGAWLQLDGDETQSKLAVQFLKSLQA